MEARISALVFEYEPVRGRLHCSTSPMAAASGWRFNGPSQVPFPLGRLRGTMESSGETFCTFTVKLVRGHYWGGEMVRRATGLNELFQFDTESRISNLLHEMIVLHLGRITYNTAEEIELGSMKGSWRPACCWFH